MKHGGAPCVMNLGVMALVHRVQEEENAMPLLVCARVFLDTPETDARILTAQEILTVLDAAIAVTNSSLHAV